MDIQQERHMEARVHGVAEPLKLKGSIRELLPKLMIWLHQTRAGDITIRINSQPIQVADVIHLAATDGALLPPAPSITDNWDSYYSHLLEHYDGAESMAEYLANEAFERPHHPWIGDHRAALFIHMNASHRLYERADPSEYAELQRYVQDKYPELYDSLSIKG
jgi:hypothetical protein